MQELPRPVAVGLRETHTLTLPEGVAGNHIAYRLRAQPTGWDIIETEPRKRWKVQYGRSEDMIEFEVELIGNQMRTRWYTVWNELNGVINSMSNKSVANGRDRLEKLGSDIDNLKPGDPQRDKWQEERKKLAKTIEKRERASRMRQVLDGLKKLEVDVCLPNGVIVSRLEFVGK